VIGGCKVMEGERERERVKDKWGREEGAEIYEERGRREGGRDKMEESL
jgi:hypothetical protein